MFFFLPKLIWTPASHVSSYIAIMKLGSFDCICGYHDIIIHRGLKYVTAILLSVVINGARIQENVTKNNLIFLQVV